jgi:hypothetical protein
MGFHGTCATGQPFIRTEPFFHSGSTDSRASTGECKGFDEIFCSRYLEQVSLNSYEVSMADFVEDCPDSRKESS